MFVAEYFNEMKGFADAMDMVGNPTYVGFLSSYSAMI
jgi:hypothetical protein